MCKVAAKPRKQHWDEPISHQQKHADRSKIQCEFITIIRAFLVRLAACVEPQVKSVQRFVVHNACQSHLLKHSPINRAIRVELESGSQGGTVERS